MRAGQFMRPGRHNKPILWDGRKCGEGGAVGTSHKILTGIYTGILTPNRNKPPPERPETNNPKPPKFSGQLLRIRDLNGPKHCENRAKVGGIRLPNHATHTTTHPKGEQHAPTRPPDAPQLALVRVPPTTYPLAVRARLPYPLLVVV